MSTPAAIILTLMFGLIMGFFVAAVVYDQTPRTQDLVCQGALLGAAKVPPLVASEPPAFADVHNLIECEAGLLLALHLGSEAMVSFVEDNQQDICSGGTRVRDFQTRYLRHMNRTFEALP